MPLPTERQLLDMWERGFAAPASVRARALLTLAEHAVTPEDQRALTLGERERALLSLRRALLGSHVSALADCPHCGERHDVAFDVDAVLGSAPAEIADTVSLSHDGVDLVVRPLTVGDYEAAARLGNARAAAELLATRCVIDARRGEEQLDPADLPETTRYLIGDALSEADPLCHLTTDLQCANCGEGWSATLDAAAYLWRELHVWAERLLHEVDVLASAYGWTEDDVLRLSPWRRAAYTALAGS
jgi:hypothetical protein